jgi:hypothetical protein
MWQDWQCVLYRAAVADGFAAGGVGAPSAATIRRHAARGRIIPER